MRRPEKLALALLVASLAAFGAPKVAPDLEGLKPGTKVDVIIQFVNPAMENEQSNVEKAGGQKKADLLTR